MSSTGLKFQNVEIDLNGHVLVRANTRVAPGDVLTVMGPSGSGKSTLLAFIGGFLDRTFTAKGKVLCSGQVLNDLPPQARRAGLLFQDPLLFPHMSVGGNLLFAAPADLKGKAERRARAEKMLSDVDLAGFFERDPDTLSGGQKARVALARVLISAPNFLLLDEPFSKLDTQLREQMRQLVFNRAREQNLPVVLVTHDSDDAKSAGGEIIQVGKAGAL